MCSLCSELKWVLPCNYNQSGLKHSSRLIQEKAVFNCLDLPIPQSDGIWKLLALASSCGHYLDFWPYLRWSRCRLRDLMLCV